MNSDLLCSCNLHPLFLSQVTARFNSGSCISEIRMFFFNYNQHLEVVLLLSPQKAEALGGGGGGGGGHPGCCWFS